MARNTNNHHVLPLFCDDLIASTVDMTPSSFGAYMRLLCYAWTRGGVPNDEQACGRIAGGFAKGDWKAIRQRFILLDEGKETERLSHQRLELERAAVAEMKEAKSRAGQDGARKRWAGRLSKNDEWQNDGRPIPVPMAEPCDGNSKAIAPTPNPSLEAERQYARAGGDPPVSLRNGKQPDPHADEEFRRPGWAHDEWSKIVHAWNVTERAVPWTPLTPPNGFADLAASPGWVDQAMTAIGLLPACQRFQRPVPWTQFVRDMDRILAGEFRDPPEPRRELVAAGGRPQKRGNMR